MKLFNRHLMRNREADSLLELFFVTAAASVLAIRFFLALADYPSLSPGNLHIAHVLLGGVVMMIALIMALGFINKSSYYLVAVLGGFGFGAFIDELGKFITGDNDYFYRPAVALIYIIFVLIYLAIETFVKKPALTPQEKLVNALEIAKEVVLEDLDHLERRQALKLIRDCPASDPVAKALRDLLYSVQAVPVRRPDIYTAIKYRLRRLYARLMKKDWFVRAFIAFFVLQSVSALLLDIFLVYVKLEWKMEISAVFPTISFFDLAGLLSATLAAGMVIAAAMKMKAARLDAYLLFKDAVMVQILLVQVFLFYRIQFLALLGLAGNIVVLFVLQYMIRQEKAAIENGR